MKKITCIVLLLTTFVTSYAKQLTDTTLLSRKELHKVKIYKNIAEALKTPDKVLVLDLSGQHLDSFPTSILEFKNLQVLKLGWKIKKSTPRTVIWKSKRIGGGIMHLDRFQGKYIDYNHLTALPTSISKLTKLQEIDLSYNNLTNVQFVLAELKNLKFNNLVGCYSLIEKESDLKRLKQMLPAGCILWSDVRLE